MNSFWGSLANAGQKNSRFFYYLRNLLKFAVPADLCRRRLAGILRAIPPGEAAAIRARVNYCNRISTPFDSGEIAEPFRFTWTQGRHNYFMDLYEYARYFPPGSKIRYRFNDTTGVPDRPTLVKARTIGGRNENAVLFKLNKIRHFVFVADPWPFESKRDQLVWRGNAWQANRKRFLERYYHHPRCDVGHAHKRKTDNPWPKGYLGIAEQLKSKFILALEGNDVASNLKRILSSNSLCFMARPRFETWFMEGTLVPGKHFVLLADDFSDVEDQMSYYSAHVAEALEIIRNANAHVARFRNEARETLVSLLVLKKYFEMSGQWPDHSSRPGPNLPAQQPAIHPAPAAGSGVQPLP